MVCRGGGGGGAEGQRGALWGVAVQGWTRTAGGVIIEGEIQIDTYIHRASKYGNIYR